MAEFFSEGIGLRIRNLALWVVAVWAGTLIAGVAGLVMELAESQGADLEIGYVLESYVLLFAALPPVNLLFTMVVLSRLTIYPESTGIFTWAVLVIGESLFCMVGLMILIYGEGYSPAAVGAAWAAWLVLAAVAGVAFRFLYQWQLNRWAAELFALQTENAVARAEMEAEAREEAEAQLRAEAEMEARQGRPEVGGGA